MLVATLLNVSEFVAFLRKVANSDIAVFKVKEDVAFLRKVANSDIAVFKVKKPVIDLYREDTLTDIVDIDNDCASDLNLVCILDMEVAAMNEDVIDLIDE
jgi:hypothetical protein